MCLNHPSRGLINSKETQATTLTDNANRALASALEQLDLMLQAKDEQSGLVHMVSLIKHLRIVGQETRSHQALSD